MSKYKVFIAEDETHARLGLIDQIERFDHWKVNGWAEDGVSALEQCLDSAPDLLLTDINMPKLNGIELVEELIHAQVHCKVIFLTAYDQFAVQAFQLNAIDYLLKPITSEHLHKSLLKVELSLQEQLIVEKLTASHVSISKLAQALQQREYRDKIVVKSAGRIDVIHIQDIYCIEAYGNYLALITADQTIMHRQTIKSLLETLNPKAFIQVHRSHIVAIDKIKTIKRVKESTVVELQNNTSIKVSQSFVPKLHKFMINES